MSARPFAFRSLWLLPVPPDRVWAEFADTGAWASWWPGVLRSAVLRPGDAEHRGQRTAVTVGSPLGPRLRFGVEITQADPPRTATVAAVGDLRGTGIAHAEPTPEGTRLTIDWTVSCEHRLLSLLRPLARWSHGRVMAAGERGLRQRLTATA